MSGGVVPGGKTAHAGLADCSDLRDSALYIGAGTKENFDDAQSIDGLRFHVLDVIDCRGDAALRVGHDAVGHILRRHTRIKPHHRDDGDIDTWEDVSRGPQNREWRQNNDDERHHDKGVGTS